MQFHFNSCIFMTIIWHWGAEVNFSLNPSFGRGSSLSEASNSFPTTFDAACNRILPQFDGGYNSITCDMQKTHILNIFKFMKRTLQVLAIMPEIAFSHNLENFSFSMRYKCVSIISEKAALFSKDFFDIGGSCYSEFSGKWKKLFCQLSEARFASVTISDWISLISCSCGFSNLQPHARQTLLSRRPRLTFVLM